VSKRFYIEYENIAENMIEIYRGQRNCKCEYFSIVTCYVVNTDLNIASTEVTNVRTNISVSFLVIVQLDAQIPFNVFIYL